MCGQDVWHRHLIQLFSNKESIRNKFKAVPIYYSLLAFIKITFETTCMVAERQLWIHFTIYTRKHMRMHVTLRANTKHARVAPSFISKNVRAQHTHTSRLRRPAYTIQDAVTRLYRPPLRTKYISRRLFSNRCPRGGRCRNT